jgi:ABC-type nickel/cobalt efflux system permease component RcnA
MNLWGLEPAMITSIVVAALTLAVSFGVPVSAEQREAIVALVSAVLVVVGGAVVRQQVVPVAKIEARKNAQIPLRVVEKYGKKDR